MNKTVFAIFFTIIGLVVFVAGASYFALSPSGTEVPVATSTPQGVSEATSPQEATYTINGTQVTLVHGVSVADAAPGSASKITTRYFGNDVSYDLDGDGRADSAFILTQDTGGSGTFYYAVAALNTPRGWVGSQGLLLGDRIAPQATTMGTGTVIVFNYADRKPGESFATAPSVGKSIWLKLDPNTMQFGEVAQNFEGEADPSRMTLGMKKWGWVRTTYGNTVVAPHIANKFTLTFSGTNTFSAATDCNGVGGEYSVNGSSIAFTKMMSTLMYCEGSQEGDYSKMFSEATSYHFTSKGELVFDLQGSGGSFIFR